MNLDALIEISRYYGKNPDYVLAGGGNTSWKDKDTLYVKASGAALADAAPESFVKLDREALAIMMKKDYPQPGEDDPFGSQRESVVLSDMMAARKIGEENKRPSVEALLHAILPFAFVVHLHPALVNGLTCSVRGEAAMKDIFATEAIWIPIANPGYELAKIIKTVADAYSAAHGKAAAILFLQNHGVFVGDNSINGIKEIYGKIMCKIGAWIKRQPDFSDEKRIMGSREQGAVSRDSRLNNTHSSFPIPHSLYTVLQTLEELAGAATFMQSKEIFALVKDRASFAPVASVFTPDHIVYSGSNPLFVEANQDIRGAWKDHADKTGRNPKTVAVQGLGVFGAAAAEKAASLALDLFKDAVKVAAYSESFGGPRFMKQDKIDFINNWEVERYRSNVSTK